MCHVTAWQLEQAARKLVVLRAEQNAFLAQATQLAGILSEARQKVVEAQEQLAAASEQVC